MVFPLNGLSYSIESDLHFDKNKTMKHDRIVRCQFHIDYHKYVIRLIILHKSTITSNF